MNFEPGQIKKAQGVLAIIMGILLAVIPLSFIFRAFGVILLLVALPNFLATASALNQKNTFVIVVFIKSLILLVLALMLIIWPEQTGTICIISGVVLLIGTCAEYFSSVDKDKYLKKEYWLVMLGLILIIMGGFSLLTTIINIIKYVLAALIVVFGVAMVCSVKKPVDNFEETLNEYERRYQETYGAQNDTDQEIIEATYEENDEERQDD